MGNHGLKTARLVLRQMTPLVLRAAATVARIVAAELESHSAAPFNWGTRTVPQPPPNGAPPRGPLTASSGTCTFRSPLRQGLRPGTPLSSLRKPYGFPFLGRLWIGPAPEPPDRKPGNRAFPNLSRRGAVFVARSCQCLVFRCQQVLTGCDRGDGVL